MTSHVLHASVNGCVQCFELATGRILPVSKAVRKVANLRMLQCSMLTLQCKCAVHSTHSRYSRRSRHSIGIALCLSFSRCIQKMLLSADAQHLPVTTRLHCTACTACHVAVAAAGPTLKFHTDLIVAVTGAAFDVKLDGSAVPLWQSFKAPQGSKLTIGKVGLYNLRS